MTEQNNGRRFQCVKFAQSDYFRYLVEHKLLYGEIEPMGKAGGLSGETAVGVFDRKTYEAEWNEAKHHRRMDNASHATGRVNGAFLKGGNPR